MTVPAATRSPDAGLPAGDPVLGEIVNRLVATQHQRRIYLFGSQARGDAGPNSDYDLLLLVDDASEPAYRLSQRGYRALRGIPAAVDVVVWDLGRSTSACT